MAQRIEGFTFTGPGRSKYPWDEWTDGDQWAIFKGEDYEIPTSNMQISLHLRAKQESDHPGQIKVSTQTIRDPQEGLVFQFYTEEEE